MKVPDEYHLGADEAEIERLGLQHRLWREDVLRCWRDAGITAGSRVIDLGAGPGFATVDLAKIVGPTGEVLAIERESRYMRALEENIRNHALTNARARQLDFSIDHLPEENFDFLWCRFVAAFIRDRAPLAKKISRALSPKGVVIFHEFASYQTWEFSPSLTLQQRFLQHLQHQRRGEGSTAMEFATELVAQGFVIESAVPRIFCIRPNDPLWQWPMAFVERTAPTRQQPDPEVAAFLRNLRAELAQAKSNANALMLTPLFLEVVARKS